MNPFEEVRRHLNRFRTALISAYAVENLGLFAFVCLFLLCAGVLLFSFIDFPPVRLVFICLFLVATSLLVIRLVVVALKLFLNPVLVARKLAEYHDELGHGLETVVELALCTPKDAPPFSIALLQAEAERQIRLLKGLTVFPMEKEVKRAKKPIILAFLLLVFLSIFLIFSPHRFANGARNLFGVTPDFLQRVLPAEQVETLAYDLKAFWIIRHEGKEERVEGLVTGAPKGTALEVSGRLFMASKQGKANLECATGTKEIPLNMLGSDEFSFSLEVEEKCFWRLEVLTNAGYRAIEKGKREVLPIEIQPPSIEVLGVDKIALGKNDVASLSFRASCRTGVAHVDAVYRSPFDPSRHENRAQVLEGQKGVNEVTGEMSVSLESLGSELVLLSLEVQCLLPDERASSVTIPFSANKQALRHLALVIGLKEVIKTLASGMDSKPKRQNATVLLKALVKESGGLATVKEETKKVLSDALGLMTSSSDENAESLLVKLHAVMEDEWRALVTEQVARLEALIQGDKGGEKQGEVARLTDMLLALNEPAIRRLVFGGGFKMSDVVSRLVSLDLLRLKEVSSKKGSAEVAQRLLSRIKERFFLHQDGTLQVLLISARQMEWLERVIEEQRGVMDETAEMAFELSKERKTEVPEDVLMEALRLCQGAFRQSQKIKVLEQFKEDMEGIQEKTKALCDLISAKDVAGAFDAASKAEYQARGLALDIRDYIQWEEGSEEENKMGTMAIRNLAQVASNIKQTKEKLATLLEERGYKVPKEKKEQIRGIALKQKAVLRDAERLFASFGKAFERLSDAQDAKENIKQAYERLLEEDPSAAETHQRQAIQDLLRLKREIARAKGKILPGGEDAKVKEPEEEMHVTPTVSTWDVKSKVMEFLHEDIPSGFEEVVKRYYESITK
jgi:hypothetical protein